MALIKCPECGKEISDKANNCIHCGCPMEEILKQKNRVKEKKVTYKNTEDMKKCIKCKKPYEGNGYFCADCATIEKSKGTYKKSNSSYETSKATLPKSTNNYTAPTDKKSKDVLSYGAIIIGIIIVLGFIGMLFGNNDSEYADNLESGREKYYSGEEMSKEEYNAVENFNDWKDNNTDKTYDEWDN